MNLKQSALKTGLMLEKERALKSPWTLDFCIMTLIWEGSRENYPRRTLPMILASVKLNGSQNSSTRYKERSLFIQFYTYQQQGKTIDTVHLIDLSP